MFEQNDLANERPDLVAKMLLEVEKGREEFGDYNRIGTASRFFDLGPKRPNTYFLTMVNFENVFIFLAL